MSLIRACRRLDVLEYALEYDRKILIMRAIGTEVMHKQASYEYTQDAG